MKRAMIGPVVVVLAMMLSVAVAQEKQKPAKGNAKAEKVEKAKPVKVRLWFPFTAVQADMSDEQKIKIDAIHKETLAKIKALKASEHESCLALLTDEQKQKVAEAVKVKEEEAAAKRKAYMEKRKAEQEAKKKAAEEAKAKGKAEGDE